MNHTKTKKRTKPAIEIVHTEFKSEGSEHITTRILLLQSDIADIKFLLKETINLSYFTPFFLNLAEVFQMGIDTSLMNAIHS